MTSDRRGALVCFIHLSLVATLSRRRLAREKMGLREFLGCWLARSVERAPLAEC